MRLIISLLIHQSSKQLRKPDLQGILDTDRICRKCNLLSIRDTCLGLQKLGKSSLDRVCRKRKCFLCLGKFLQGTVYTRFRTRTSLEGNYYLKQTFTFLALICPHFLNFRCLSSISLLYSFKVLFLRLDFIFLRFSNELL